MDEAVIKIQSAYRGYVVRKSKKNYKQKRNSIDWRFNYTGNLYKSSSFGIIDDYYKGLPRDSPDLYLKKLTPKAFNPVLVKSFPAQSFALLKKPLITIFYQEAKTLDSASPRVLSPPRSSRPSVSIPHHFSISAQKTPPRQSQKQKVTLVKYTMTPLSKPVVPIQTCKPKQGRREKFLKEIKEVKSQFQLEKPLELPRPKTQKFDNRPQIKNTKSVTARNKFVSLDKYMIITPETTSRMFYSSKKVLNEGKESSGPSCGPSPLETNKGHLKLSSPYMSVWPEKLLLQYYNLKLCPSEQSGTKRFKLVKVHGKKKKKMSAEMAEQYLRF